MWPIIWSTLKHGHEWTLFADLQHFGTQNDCFGTAPWRVGPEGPRPPKPHIYIDAVNGLT